VSSFIEAVRTGTKREVAAFGARGDGKTWGALTAMIAHAQQHHASGFPLPVKWLGATGTFEGHKSKTHDSLQAAGWRGCWTLHDQGHQATFDINGQRLVDLRLFGVEDEKGMERLRAEAHCVWFEEAAPAEEIGSRGMSENHWGMAITSMRLPSHANVAIATQNYPDEEHWTWQRWHEREHPGSLMFEIPPGERATAEQRSSWAEAIKDPVMRKRLIDGKPGTIVPGRPVAHGFNEAVHVSRVPLHPRPGGQLWLGQDGGLMPATVIGQRSGGRIEILAGMTSHHAGIRQHFKYVLIPWLGEHAPWILEIDRPNTLLHVCYDETMDTDSQADSETNPLQVMHQLLPGIYRPGQNNPWSWRRDPLLAALSSMDDGVPMVVVDRSCKQLIRAWNGMWHYAITSVGDVRKEEPKKPYAPWADLGDASAYLIADMAPTRGMRTRGPKKPATLAFDPYAYDRTPQRRPATIEFTP
jgi:hypothetical protein